MRKTTKPALDEEVTKAPGPRADTAKQTEQADADEPVVKESSTTHKDAIKKAKKLMKKIKQKRAAPAEESDEEDDLPVDESNGTLYMVGKQLKKALT